MTVASARLEVYAYDYESSNTFQLYRATSTWDESTTWEPQPTCNDATLWDNFSTTEERKYVRR